MAISNQASNNVDKGIGRIFSPICDNPRNLRQKRSSGTIEFQDSNLSYLTKIKNWISCNIFCCNTKSKADEAPRPLYLSTLIMAESYGVGVVGEGVTVSTTGALVFVAPVPPPIMIIT